MVSSVECSRQWNKNSTRSLDLETGVLVNLTNLSREMDQNPEWNGLNRKWVKRKEMEAMNMHNSFKKFGSGAWERESAKTGLEIEVNRWDSLESV